MLAFRQHNFGLCRSQRPTKWAQFRGLLPSFGAFSPVLGPSAQFQGVGGGGWTGKYFVSIYEYDLNSPTI